MVAERLDDRVQKWITSTSPLSTPCWGTPWARTPRASSYAPTRVGAPQGEDIEFGGLTIPAELPFSVRQIEGVPVPDFGWPVVPKGLTELLTGFHDRYGDRLPPVVITENGCSYQGLDDQQRIAYLDGHLRALHRASEEGVDVRGYFVWSLLDNFE